MADSAVPVRSAYKSSIIPEINPVPTCCFCLKSFLWKGPQTIKIKKKTIRFWATSVSILKYVQI